ncbi:MAG: lipB [Bacteroidota bacterium]|nr:lipB [Bacteroidota bacterium]
MQHIDVIDAGLIKYADALEIQTQKFNLLIQNKIEGISNSGHHALILCEHEPVITLGKSSKPQNLLFSQEFLSQKNIGIVPINRGGDITFHGPGQIVGYPILDLDFFTSDLKKYMRMLEEVIILTIAVYHLEGYRIEGETGVWVNSNKDKKPKKICAFGVKTSRWVTMHGFALNVNVDLHYFHFIVPCGIPDKGVTSLREELPFDYDLSTEEVKQHIIHNFAKVFNAELAVTQSVDIK